MDFRRPARLRAGQALTVGTYDGLHLGHQALLERLREHARRLGVPTLMVTFEPMPREFLTPDNPPARLTCFGNAGAAWNACGWTGCACCASARRPAP